MVVRTLYSSVRVGNNFASRDEPDVITVCEYRSVHVVTRTVLSRGPPSRNHG